MQVSDWGRKVIMNFEGFSAKPYKCPAGVLTQGYGHTSAAGGAQIGRPPVWSKAFAERVLIEDLNTFGRKVEMLVTREMTQGQFDAFVSLAFNIGLGAFGKSTALRRFNDGDVDGASEAITWFNKARINGQLVPLAGLIRRRNSERLMFNGVQDLNFDGDRDPSEPVYGALPQGNIEENLGGRVSPKQGDLPPDVEPTETKPVKHVSDTVAKVIRVVIVVAIVAAAIYFLLK